MKEWKEFILEDLGFVGRGKSRHRPRNAEFLFGNKYPFVQTGDVKAANYRILEYSQMYSEEGLKQSKLWPVNTLCVTIAANIADAALLGFEACFPDSVIGFIANENKADVRFVKYLFDLLQARIKKISQGAAQDNLSLQKLRTIKFLVPPLPTQHKIATILSAYDDLIENNLKRIKLLEEKAQLTYEEWFVRMKFPGHEKVGIDEETGLPEGWGKIDLNKYISIKHGYAFKGKFFQSDKTNKILLTPGNFRIGGGIKLKKLKYYSEKGPINKDYVLEKHDLLITMTDLSKQGDTLGFPLLVPSSNNRTYLLNQRLGKVLPKNSDCFPKYFLRMYFQDKLYRSFVVGSANGATVKHTSPTKILFFKPKLPLLDSKIIKKFDALINPIFDMIDNLLLEQDLLKEARDIMLPRLMMGMIDVNKMKIKEIDHAHI